MANNGKNIIKVPVYGPGLRKAIQKAGYSIRSISKKIGYGDRTLRDYLNKNEMPVPMLDAIEKVVGDSIFFTGYKFTEASKDHADSENGVIFVSEKQNETTAQTVSMEVNCIGKECVNCPQLDIEISRNVIYGRTECIYSNYLSCKNLGMCLRIKDHLLRKNSNSDNEKDGV